MPASASTSTSTLLMWLDGPMQSWGVGDHYDNRYTERVPTLSGIVGMICSALGVPRDDTDAMSSLSSNGMAVRVDAHGSLLSDYQTRLNGPKGDRAATLRERMVYQKCNSPVVYEKQFLMDARFLVALPVSDERWDDVVQALAHPAHPLFLGRRRCAPAEPILFDVRTYDRKSDPMSVLSSVPWQCEPELARTEYMRFMPSKNRADKFVSRPHELTETVRLPVVASVSLSEPSQFDRVKQVRDVPLSFVRGAWEWTSRLVVHQSVDVPNPYYKPSAATPAPSVGVALPPSQTDDPMEVR